MRAPHLTGSLLRAAGTVSIAALVLVGCGGSSHKDSSATTAQQTQPTSPSTTAKAKAGGDPDVCGILTLAKVNAALGTSFDQSNNTGVIAGGPTTDCEYSSSSDSYAVTINYLGDDLGGAKDDFATERTLQMGDADLSACSGTIDQSCFQALSGIGDQAFVHVDFDGELKLELVAHKGDATLTLGADLAETDPTGGQPGADVTPPITGLTSLAHLIFP